MKTQEIRDLLERYYEGKTSLYEEKTLKEYFQQEIVPEELLAEREVFMVFSESKRDEVLDEKFDDEIMKMIYSQTDKKATRTRLLYIASSVAAGIALLIGTFFFVFEYDNMLGSRNTFEMAAIHDPETALEETRKTLYMVSEIFNKGTGQLSSISKFSDGTGSLMPLSKFNEGTTALQPLDKIYDVEQILTSKK